MISHEVHRIKTKWYKTLLMDFIIPLAAILILGYLLDKRWARPFLQQLVDLPYIGNRLYRSPFFAWYGKWHSIIFDLPFLLASFAISFKTARIPGPGRAFLHWWQELLQLKVKKERHVDPFPPPFDRKKREVVLLIREVMSQELLARVVGYYKRFTSDLEKDIREGKEPENEDFFFPIILTEELRYRHIQVVGGSGSGKSAAVIAPVLKEDAINSKLATLTINPKADLYLIKVMVDGVMKRKKFNPADKLPTAVISFSRKESLAYDPLLYGDADALTKKIMGSSEIVHAYYKSFQESWLMSFFRVVKTEPEIVDRVMLRHLYHFLMKPQALLEQLKPLCHNPHNLMRLNLLSAAKPESLSGVASHISQLVEDESLTHIFDNPEGNMLNLREVINKGGNIFIEVDTSSKGPQGRALGRMIMMEIQLLAGARQAGHESKAIGVQVFLDEFASFAYNGFIDLIDKCRSARVGLLLSHQSLGNLQRDNLSKSFKDEIVDNTYTKFFLSLKDETAEWASRLLGTRKVIKKSISISQSTGKTDTGAHETRTLSFREEFEPYVQPSDFNLEVGYGYASIENTDGRLLKAPIRLGYVDEKDLCSDAELFSFIREATKDHSRRPRNGSLIDNKIPPGSGEWLASPVVPLLASDINPHDSCLITNSLKSGDGEQETEAEEKLFPEEDPNPPD